jgi:hypothetical protein
MLTGNLLTVSAAAKGTGKNVWSNYSNLKKAIQKSDLVDEGNRYIYYMSGKDFYCITYLEKSNSFEFDALLNYSLGTGQVVSMVVKKNDVNKKKVQVSCINIDKQSSFMAVETIKMTTFTGRNGTCRIKSTYGNPGRRNKMISRTKKSVDTAFSGWDLVLMNQTNNISLKKLGFSRY